MKSKLEYILDELAQYMIYGEIKPKAYKEEKIVPLDPKIKDIKQIYKKFTKIEEENYFSIQVGETFYKQAKLLENFEDNYETEEIQRYSYNPFNIDYTYSEFTFTDFRTYFSWRTKIRKGIFEQINYEYEQIYINELLNKIGCKNATEAIYKLIEFWKGYRQFTVGFDNIMPDIIKEFYITNDISIPYTEITLKYPIQIKTISKDLKEIKKGIYHNKISFFNDISTYKIEKSKLLETEYGYLLNECIEKVFCTIHNEFEKNGMILPDMLVYKEVTNYFWKPLSSYTIYEMNRKDKEIIIEGTEKYVCKNGDWNKTIYTTQIIYKNVIGYILKTIECYIREYLGYRKLKLPEKEEILNNYYGYYYEDGRRKLSKIKKIYKMNLQEIIEKEVLQYLNDRRIPKDVFKKKKEGLNEFEKEEKIEIKFNQEQFTKIRQKSEEIQKALIIEEIEETEENSIKEPKKEVEQVQQKQKEVAETLIETQEVEKSSNENIFKKFVCDLTQTEKEMIQIILKKQDVENKIHQIAQNQNEMLEVIVSNINGKALETIGDTVIESNMTSIYEDYEQEIKQML